MLVLSRKFGERILIGDDIVITVVRVDKDKVRIGVDAPKEVLILREEVPPEKPSDAVDADKSDSQ